ncbi:MAG: CotH kinase family protein [Solirubrobacterales bacterium]
MRKGGFILAGILTLLVSLSSGAQAARADDAATIYDPGAVLIVDLTLSPSAEAELEADPGEDVEGTFKLSMTSDGTPTGTESVLVPEHPAEIHLKGSVGGSFRELDEKPGFKVKFKKTETVLGLRKLTLNNMVQDPSMVHETLAYAAFRANGLPASRTGFAYVRLNSHDIGVYLDLESLDDIALAKVFGSFDKDTGQHLYEGEQGDDVVPGGAEDFEVDEGNDEPGEQEDLEALIEAVNGAGPAPWSGRVDPYADLAEMTRFWAVEKYIDHWDGYSGHASQEQVENGERPNNYYLYSDPSGRFQMLPWGTDQAWVFTEGVPSREVTFDGKGGVLFNKCLEDNACFRLYWEALGEVTEAVASLGPEVLAEDAAELLEPWQVQERAHGRPDPESDAAGEVEAALHESLDFIDGRQGEAEEWLLGHVPPTPPSAPAVIGKGSSSVAQSPPPTAPNVHPKLRRIDRRALSHGIVAVDVAVPGPGRLAQLVLIRTAHGLRRACHASRDVSGAGMVTVRCHLPSAIRHRPGNRRLRFQIRIRFTPATGSPTVIKRPLDLSSGR